MTTVQTYKQVILAQQQMVAALDAYGIPHQLSREVRLNSRHSFDDLKDYFDTSDGDGYKLYTTFYDYIDGLMATIQSHRNRRRSRETYNPMGKYKTLSKNMADKVLGTFFPRSTTRVHIVNTSNDVGIERDHIESSYLKSTDVMITKAWHRTVYERGIAIINSSKGKRFILSAKPIDVKYCNDEGMTVYRVTAVEFKNGLGKIEHGYLCTYGDTSEDNPAVATQDGKDAIPHSYSDTVTKAYKLLRQRAVRNMTKMFNI